MMTLVKYFERDSLKREVDVPIRDGGEPESDRIQNDCQANFRGS